MQMKKNQLDIGVVLLVIEKLQTPYLRDEPAILWLIPYLRNLNQLNIDFQKNTMNKKSHRTWWGFAPFFDERCKLNPIITYITICKLNS